MMNVLCNGSAFPAGRAMAPVRVLQFGEGVFLRAFAEDLFDDLAQKGLFDGSVAVVQPRPGAGKLDALRAQDGLYTLVLRGLVDGAAVERSKVVSVVSEAVDPYAQHDAYLSVCESPDLRFVVSNTTEAGIAYRAEDRLDDKPALGFPAKVAQLLYRRYTAFQGDASKGLIFLPCELIERNGSELKRIAMQHAQDWGLDQDFFRWVDASCTFANTLVDRIVSGYPQGEAEAMCARLGYTDALLDVAEPYGLFAIEGAPDLATELAVDQASMNVVLTDDIAPYRTRKVRILNGAHTALTPVALLMGAETVGGSLKQPQLKAYLTRLLHDEVIPAMGGDAAALRAYAAAVFERFENPFLQHRLSGIALNSASKWRARLLPTLTDYVRAQGTLPSLLTFAFAATQAMFEAGIDGVRDADDFGQLRSALQGIPGFEAAVQAARADIATKGLAKALEMRL